MIPIRVMATTRRLIGVLAALACGAGLAISGSQGQPVQKPAVVEHFRTEARGGVGTFSELWSLSDVIIEGIVEGDRETDYQLPAPQITTTYDVRILEVFKSSAEVTTTTALIPVRRQGGIRDRNILFLVKREWVRPAPYTGLYFTEATRTADSVFKVTDSGLSTSGRARLSQSLVAAESSTASLRGLLRRHGR
jgi:hypothetical protein